MVVVDHDDVRSFSQLHQRVRRESGSLLARLIPLPMLRRWMIDQKQGNKYRNDPKRLFRSMLSKDPPPDAWLITKAALERYFHATPEAVPMITKYCRRVGLDCDDQATLAPDAEPWDVKDERAVEAYEAFRGEYDPEAFALYGLYFAGMAGWERHPKLVNQAMEDLKRVQADKKKS